MMGDNRDDEDSNCESPTQEPTIDSSTPSNLSGNFTQPCVMECSQSSLQVAPQDLYICAKSRLESLAQDNGFSIHDVPYDGDCLLVLLHINWNLQEYVLLIVVN